MRRAPSAKRPLGEVARKRRPTSRLVCCTAMRWTEWPSTMVRCGRHANLLGSFSWYFARDAPRAELGLAANSCAPMEADPLVRYRQRWLQVAAASAEPPPGYAALCSSRRTSPRGDLPQIEVDLNRSSVAVLPVPEAGEAHRKSLRRVCAWCVPASRPQPGDELRRAGDALRRRARRNAAFRPSPRCSAGCRPTSRAARSRLHRRGRRSSSSSGGCRAWPHRRRRRRRGDAARLPSGSSTRGSTCCRAASSAPT